MGRVAKLTSELTSETQKVSSLAGTFADFMYQGEEMFLQEVAKRIKKIAGGHAQSVRVVRSGGRSPHLDYKGEDRSDMSLEFVMSVFASSSSDVTLSWWGTSAMGKFDSKRSFKWGQLKPELAASVFHEVFGR